MGGAVSPTPAHTSETEIGYILRDINRYWRGGGVPRRERQDRLAELRAHLDEAVAEGRGVRAVVGPDIYAFAAGWIQADRSHPVVDIVLRFIAFVTLVTVVHALLGPVVFGLDGFAIRSQSLTLTAVIATFLLATDIVQMFRSRLERSTMYLLTALAFLGVGVTSMTLAALFGDWVSPALPVPLLVLLSLLGGLCAAVSWNMRHTRRTRRRS